MPWPIEAHKSNRQGCARVNRNSYSNVAYVGSWQSVMGCLMADWGVIEVSLLCWPEKLWLILGHIAEVINSFDWTLRKLLPKGAATAEARVKVICWCGPVRSKRSFRGMCVCVSERERERQTRSVYVNQSTLSETPIRYKFLVHSIQCIPKVLRICNV